MMRQHINTLVSRTSKGSLFSSSGMAEMKATLKTGLAMIESVYVNDVFLAEDEDGTQAARVATTLLRRPKFIQALQVPLTYSVCTSPKGPHSPESELMSLALDALMGLTQVLPPAELMSLLYTTTILQSVCALLKKICLFDHHSTHNILGFLHHVALFGGSSCLVRCRGIAAILPLLEFSSCHGSAAASGVSCEESPQHTQLCAAPATCSVNSLTHRRVLATIMLAVLADPGLVAALRGAGRAAIAGHCMDVSEDAYQAFRAACRAQTAEYMQALDRELTALETFADDGDTISTIDVDSTLLVTAGSGKRPGSAGSNHSNGGYHSLDEHSPLRKVAGGASSAPAAAPSTPAPALVGTAQRSPPQHRSVSCESGVAMSEGGHGPDSSMCLRLWRWCAAVAGALPVEVQPALAPDTTHANTNTRSVELYAQTEIV